MDIMKIYFAGSITGGRDDKDLYFSIIQDLGKYGLVLTEHIGDNKLTNLGEDKHSPEYIFERDMSWVRESDLIVAEVTTPSLGVGYEIGQAQSMGKNIVCLYRKVEGKKLSSMIFGNRYLKIYEYKSLEDIKRILEKYFSNEIL